MLSRCRWYKSHRIYRYHRSLLVSNYRSVKSNLDTVKNVLCVWQYLYEFFASYLDYLVPQLGIFTIPMVLATTFETVSVHYTKLAQKGWIRRIIGILLTITTSSCWHRHQSLIVVIGIVITISWQSLFGLRLIMVIHTLTSGRLLLIQLSMMCVSFDL